MQMSIEDYARTRRPKGPPCWGCNLNDAAKNAMHKAYDNGHNFQLIADWMEQALEIKGVSRAKVMLHLQRHYAKDKEYADQQRKQEARQAAVFWQTPQKSPYHRFLVSKCLCCQ